MVILSHGHIASSAKLARLAPAMAALLVWAAAASSALYWSLRLSQAPGTAAPAAQVSVAAPADPQLVARLLGVRAASPAVQASLSSRFSLQGVVAGGLVGGAALIAVDGKPAAPFALGSVVDEGLVLRSITARSVTLAANPNGPALVTLDMPQFN